MGLIASSSSAQSRAVNNSSAIINNLPPLLFHEVHGENVKISRDGSVARRVESFCKGLVFSARPVKINERIFLRFVDVSRNWSGVLRFGFTSNDPAALAYSLPKYACPDLTNKPGYWAKAFVETLCEPGGVLFYYVSPSGDVHFGLNGEEKGVYFSGVDTRGQLWALMDIYGNSTAVEFLDPRQQMNNARRHANNEVSTRLITANVANMSISPPHHSVHPKPPCLKEPTPPPLRFQHSTEFLPLPFHRTRGKNVRLNNDRCLASRDNTEFSQGYVFTARPIIHGEKLVVQILATEQMYLGALALGLTACDPATLSPGDLPDDSDLLLDRPEYWVVNKDVAGGPQRGDELTFCITTAGEVQMSKNGGPSVSLMHIDQSQTLWAFLDIYGSTQKIRILGSLPPPVPQVTPPRSLVPSSSVQQERCRPTCTVAATHGVGGGTVLVVNLPPPTATHVPGYKPSHHTQAHFSTFSPTYVEPISGSSYSTLDASDGIREWARDNVISPVQSSDCSVCYERTIDSVLYTCGHMCMCYECSVQQWRGKGGGQCPLCRAVIKDVIRTFKS